MQSNLLHVVSVISNPIRWHSRLRLFRNFVKHMLESGVQLHIVECAYGDRPYEIPVCPQAYHLIRVRTNSVCWIKESLINIGISRLPDDWQYVAWLDGDIFFRHKHWATEVINALQQYPIVQPWATAYDLGPNGEGMDHHRSFAYLHWHGRLKGIGPGYEFCHPGYGWAAKRSAVDQIGGLIDFAICGAGDHHMACAMVGKVLWSVPKGMSEDYIDPLVEWQRRAVAVTQKNIGFCPGSIEHHWHGKKIDRHYIDRWQILIKNNYEPDTDIKRNTYGVVNLAGNKPNLTHDMDVYHRQRNEDLTWHVQDTEE